MLTLPPALGTLSKLVSKPGQPRYQTAEGVCVAATPDGWEAAATDFKRMLLVSGPHPDPKPEYAALADAPNGATAASVPAKWWADTFNGAKKLRGIPGVGLVLSSAVASGSNGTTLTRTEVIPGKLAPFADILPKREGDIGCVVRFDPELMAGLLKALADLTDPGADPVVTMEVRRPSGPHGGDKAVVIRADYPAAGITAATGLLMPCAAKGDDHGQGTRFFRPESGEGCEPNTSHAAETERRVQAEGDRARLEVEAKRLLAEVDGLRDGAIQQGRVIDILREQIEGQATEIRLQRGETDATHALLARFRDETEHGNELVGLWGRLGDAERTTRDAVTEIERLRAELDAVRTERDKLLADVDAIRKTPVPTPRPAPTVTHHRPSATPGVRRTLGELAAAKAGA